MKSLNEQCNLYGLRAKPTTLVELPFGTLVRSLVELVLVVFLVYLNAYCTLIPCQL